MEGPFNIKRGIYNVPGVGRIDTRNAVDEETQLKLYKVSRKKFPFIYWNENSRDFLKKQKLDYQEIGRMIFNAQTEQEINDLTSLSRKSIIKSYAETRLKIIKAEV